MTLGAAIPLERLYDPRESPDLSNPRHNDRSHPTRTPPHGGADGPDPVATDTIRMTEVKHPSFGTQPRCDWLAMNTQRGDSDGQEAQ